MRSLNPSYVFGWNVAIERLAEGKKVTRCSWSDHFYYPIYLRQHPPVDTITENFIVMVNLRANGPRVIPWHPGTLDLIASDWTIFNHKDNF